MGLQPNAFETGTATRLDIGNWITFYNTTRPHSALGGKTPLKAHQCLNLKAAP
ncbi:integrase core domain-containing protein [Thioclava kandeliae]|uniref:integrase core domain-containing protein n=1 Tax=Thioclava kandeliae TaxID=3070818 RepID=UPI0033280A09